MTNSIPEKHSDKKHVQDDNFDTKSTISIASRKSMRSTKSNASVRSIRSSKSALSVRSTKNAKDISYCCCPDCPGRNSTPQQILPPKLKRDIECNNINEVLPPIIPRTPKQSPSSTQVKNEAAVREASPTPSVRSVKSVKSTKSTKTINERNEIKQQQLPEKNGSILVEKPIELRASILMNYCDCVKKNGLQDHCPRFKCKKPISDYA